MDLKDILRRSFEDFFSEDFHYQKTNIVSALEKQVKDLTGRMDNLIIVTEEPKKRSLPKYGLANISVDANSFKSWLLSDPHGDGNACIADMLTIIKPTSLNEELAEYSYYQLLNKTKYLRDNLKKNLVRALEMEEN